MAGCSKDGTRRTQEDWSELQDKYNTGKEPNLRLFAERHGIPYETIRKQLRHSLRTEFQEEVRTMARHLLMQKKAEEVARLMERHLKLSGAVEAHIIDALNLNEDPGGEEGGRVIPIPDDADQAARLLRVLLENVRLQRTIYGEPEQVTEQQGVPTQVSLGLQVIVDRASEILTSNPEILDAIPGEEPVEAEVTGDGQ